MLQMRKRNQEEKRVLSKGDWDSNSGFSAQTRATYHATSIQGFFACKWTKSEPLPFFIPTASIYPLAFHGVSNFLGSGDLSMENERNLEGLKAAEENGKLDSSFLNPLFISDF